MPHRLGCCPSALALALVLGGCQGTAQLIGTAPSAGPMPPGITVVFNHNESQRYRSPIHRQWRRGDNLEAFLLEAIADARHEILVAVQELSLPRVA